VEISAVGSNLVFRVTPLGAEQAPRDQLSAAIVTQPKHRSFAIEQVTGGVFRTRELDMRPVSQLPIGTDDQIVIHLPSSKLSADDDLTDVFTAIEGEDELIVGVEPNPGKLIERYAVVTVRDEVVEGLPARASPVLRDLIVARAIEALAAAVSTEKPPHERPAAATEPEPAAIHPGPGISHSALYDPDDLILDGPAHVAAFERLIRNASERIIIHSTFVTEQRAQATLPLLLHASTKGVRTDVFWGQDDIGSATTSSQAAAARLAVLVAEAGRSDSIKVHPFSTSSHAKIVVADTGRGRWQALLGSCNWLASDFTSFEASVRLRDPALVGLLIRKLAGLVRGRAGIWDNQTVEMTVLGRRIESLPRGNGRTVPMRLLFAPDHARLILQARDRARNRIFVLSHRLGIAGKPVALLPILAAVKARGIEAAVYYGRTTGPLTGADGADITRQFAQQGLHIRPVHRPRIHAKALGWDDDALAISSFNWLSAEPPDAALNREIGVLIEGARAGETFIRVFENARLE
jgi:phosphatidylserine/phosphatidylglycerophosphate/cardiolipin synthase-like enzyme